MLGRLPAMLIALALVLTTVPTVQAAPSDGIVEDACTQPTAEAQGTECEHDAVLELGPDAPVGPGTTLTADVEEDVPRACVDWDQSPITEDQCLNSPVLVCQDGDATVQSGWDCGNQTLYMAYGPNQLWVNQTAPCGYEIGSSEGVLCSPVVGEIYRTLNESLPSLD